MLGYGLAVVVAFGLLVSGLVWVFVLGVLLLWIDGGCLVLICLVVWACGCDSVVDWWVFDSGVCSFGLFVSGLA